MLKIKRLRNFDRISNVVSLQELKQYILPEGNYAVELFDDEKIIHLNIPHGNIYSECSPKEWDEILKYLKDLGLTIPEK